MTIQEQVARARRAATPIVAIETPDQVGVVKAMQGLGNGTQPAIVEWDCLRGVRPGNDEGVVAIAAAEVEHPEDILDGASAVEFTSKLPRKAILFMHHAGAALENNPAMVQALSTARDRLKNRGVMVALMGVSVNVPSGLHHDVVRLIDPLPGDEQLARIAQRAMQSYKSWSKKQDNAEHWHPPTVSDIEYAASGIRGLSAFAAEQAAAVTIFESGHFDGIAEERNAAINSIPGLSVDDCNVNFDDMRGCNRARDYMRRLCDGPESPQLILRIDELEKKLAGSADHERAGATGADELQVLLQAMESCSWSGVIAFGHPGTAKTMWCQAVGPTFGIPSIELDLGSTRSKFVGESEAHIRAAIDTVKSIGGERVHVMATCNELRGLPPELRRRFTDGIVFFDLPSAHERCDMWNLYMARYDISGLAPDMEGLTGAEIRNICRLAYRMGVSLEEASKDVVPICKGDREGVARRRKAADGRYRNAAEPGVYTMPRENPTDERDMG